MPQNAPVRIGIIGAGGYMREHMSHYGEIPEAEVVAFSRRNEDRLKEAQAEWSVSHGFTDYRDLLNSDEVDAVSIITPTDSHKQIALDAAEAGKHILCEKPLALTAADAKAMLDTAERAGIVHAVNFNQRGRTPVGQMARLIDNGYIGRPYHFNIWWGMSQAPEDRPEIGSWRFRKETGGGTVYELIHVLDMARLLGGEVSRMCSLLNTAVKHRPFADVPEGMDIEVEDSSAFLIEFQSGAYCVAHTSFASKGTDENGRSNVRVEVSGSNGRLVNDGLERLRGMTGVTGPLGDVDGGAPYPQPYYQFVNAILTGEPVLQSFYDGYKAAELADAAFQSYREGRWVDVTGS